MLWGGWRILAIGLGMGVSVESGVHAQVTPPSIQPVIEQAREFVEQTFEFERAVTNLNTAIDLMTAAPQPDPDLLAEAYDLRSQAHFSLNDLEQATLDFEQLLRVKADYLLPDDLSPRIVDLFESVRQSLVGTLVLDLPQPVTVTIDGRGYLVNGPAVIDLLGGDHELAIRQPGFRQASQRFMITPGEFTTLHPTVERTSATRSIITVPSGVEVIVDGIVRGVTPPGGEGEASAPFVVDGLMSGQHRLRLERDCYSPIATEFGVADPPDDRTETLELAPAVATATIQTSVLAASIYVDGEPRGLAPAVLDDLCEGPHVVEVRGPGGRFFDRRVWSANSNVTLDAILRPAFAIVEVAGAVNAAGGVDLARRVEETLAGARGTLVFAPSSRELQAVRQGPQGVALAEPTIRARTRRDLADGWSEQLRTQGVAWVVPVVAPDIVDLFLLARESSVPDVLRLNLGDFRSRAVIERRLNATPLPVVRNTLETIVVDVVDIAGAAVVQPEPRGVGAQAGLRPGDVVIGASDSTVSSVAELRSIVEAATPSSMLRLEVDDGTGATRTVDIRVAIVPDTIPFGDGRLLYNKVLLDLQASRREAGDALRRSATELNIAIVQMQLERWDLALGGLESVVLPDGPGVSAATVKYLTGVCLKAMGQFGEARELLREVVVGGEGALALGGPAIVPLAEHELESTP